MGDIILFDSNYHEIGPEDLEMDIEVGDSSAANDFQATPGETNFYGFYIPGTEIGGVLEYQYTKSDSTENTLKGWTWRGLLTQWIIEPPKGSDYRTVSGEANTIIRSLLTDVLGEFFEVPEEESGLTITNYQFKLYTTVLDGLMDMLDEYGYRLDIYTEKPEPGGKIQVYCRALPAKKLEGEYNNDVGLTLAFTNNQMGINHLVCMGKGELQERQRVDLYISKNGKVSETKYYTGFDERIAYCDYSNAESMEELKKTGTERLKGLASYKKLEVEAESVDLNVGDIVVGRYRETGLVVEAPIDKKIYRISGGKMSIEYGVKEET